jgi:hypothetical protein
VRGYSHPKLKLKFVLFCLHDIVGSGKTLLISGIRPPPTKSTESSQACPLMCEQNNANLVMIMNELIEYLKESYQNIRVLDDGTIIATGELLFTRAIYIGLDRWGFEKRFCFEDRNLAIKEFLKLQTGDDEPTGWIARR